MASIDEAFKRMQEEREKPIDKDRPQSKREYPLNPPNDMCNGCLKDRGSTIFVKTMNHTCYKHFEDIFKVKPEDAWGFDPNVSSPSTTDKLLNYLQKQCDTTNSRIGLDELNTLQSISTALYNKIENMWVV